MAGAGIPSRLPTGSEIKRGSMNRTSIFPAIPLQNFTFSRGMLPDVFIREPSVTGNVLVVPSAHHSATQGTHEAVATV